MISLVSCFLNSRLAYFIFSTYWKNVINRDFVYKGLSIKESLWKKVVTQKFWSSSPFLSFLTGTPTLLSKKDLIWFTEWKSKNTLYQTESYNRIKELKLPTFLWSRLKLNENSRVKPLDNFLLSIKKTPFHLSAFFFRTPPPKWVHPLWTSPNWLWIFGDSWKF